MHTLEIGKSLQRLLHIRRQNGDWAETTWPASGRVHINVHGANLAADVLALDDAAALTRGKLQLRSLEDADFNVGGVERFVLDRKRFDHFDPLRLVYQLTVRSVPAKSSLYTR